jgi:hypothetical protein
MKPTHLLMSASALVLGLLGALGSFAPDHVLAWLAAPASPALLLAVQVLGALYLGFAALNWMTRHNLIGGIYGRPVVVANLLHFVSAGLAIVRLVARAPQLTGLWPLAAAYVVFATGFGVVLFRHPIRTPPR